MKRRIFVMLSILFIGIGMAWSQVRSVKGVVTSSEDGLPVVGASVLVSGTTMGSITDVDGKFSISKVPSSAETLTISYVGMRTKVVAITSEVMQIILDSDSKILDEVVVTAQGLTRQEKSLGYSIQKVDAEDLTIARQTDLNNALAGKVSGVRFLGSSGATFDGGRIVLRGTSSLTESSGVEPIYVIDGVMSEDANSVNMDDVESINVLKGPAATALYGSRGGNGAVIITTNSTVVVTWARMPNFRCSTMTRTSILHTCRHWTERLTMTITTTRAGVRPSTTSSICRHTHGIRMTRASARPLHGVRR